MAWIGDKNVGYPLDLMYNKNKSTDLVSRIIYGEIPVLY